MDYGRLKMHIPSWTPYRFRHQRRYKLSIKVTSWTHILIIFWSHSAEESSATAHGESAGTIPSLLKGEGIVHLATSATLSDLPTSSSTLSFRPVC